MSKNISDDQTFNFKVYLYASLAFFLLASLFQSELVMGFSVAAAWACVVFGIIKYSALLYRVFVEKKDYVLSLKEFILTASVFPFLLFVLSASLREATHSQVLPALIMLQGLMMFAFTLKDWKP